MQLHLLETRSCDWPLHLQPNNFAIASSESLRKRYGLLTSIPPEAPAVGAAALFSVRSGDPVVLRCLQVSHELRCHGDSNGRDSDAGSELCSQSIRLGRYLRSISVGIRRSALGGDRGSMPCGSML